MVEEKKKEFDEDMEISDDDIKTEEDLDKNEQENEDENFSENLTEEEELSNKQLHEELKEKEELLAKLEEDILLLEKEKEEYINRLQRLQAEYSNYRKRSDKEKGQIQSTVAIELIRDILPIIDNFERALSQSVNDDDFCKGVEMIYRQLINFLKNQGVEEIETRGQEFDHNIHNAVAQVESDEYESGIVVEEVQKGYILADKVVRPAMVKVVH
ncbi:MAG: nucleotide exchange factor GrpE [Bacillota bacterium]